MPKPIADEREEGQKLKPEQARVKPFTRIEELDYHKYFCYRDWIFFFSNHKIQSRGDQIFIIFTTNFLGSESKQGK